MDAAELARWTRFAAKGGIGKCTAVKDCVAKSGEDLMFLKGDEITVLMQIAGDKELFLGYCEGVIGRFVRSHVRFHAKLKRPVITKRPGSSSGTNSSPSNSTGVAGSPSINDSGSLSVGSGIGTYGSSSMSGSTSGSASGNLASDLTSNSSSIPSLSTPQRLDHDVSINNIIPVAQSLTLSSDSSTSSHLVEPSSSTRSGLNLNESLQESPKSVHYASLAIQRTESEGEQGTRKRPETISAVDDDALHDIATTPQNVGNQKIDADVINRVDEQRDTIGREGIGREGVDLPQVTITERARLRDTDSQGLDFDQEHERARIRSYINENSSSPLSSYYSRLSQMVEPSSSTRLDLHHDISEDESSDQHQDNEFDLHEKSFPPPSTVGIGRRPPMGDIRESVRMSSSLSSSPVVVERETGGMRRHTSLRAVLENESKEGSGSPNNVGLSSRNLSSESLKNIKGELVRVEGEIRTPPLSLMNSGSRAVFESPTQMSAKEELEIAEVAQEQQQHVVDEELDDDASLYLDDDSSTQTHSTIHTSFNKNRFETNSASLNLGDSTSSSFIVQRPSPEASLDGGLGVGLAMLQDLADLSSDEEDEVVIPSLFSRRAATVSTQAQIELQRQDTVRANEKINNAMAVSPTQQSSLEPQNQHDRPLVVPPSPIASLHPSSHSGTDDDSEWDGAADIYDDYRYSRYSMASKVSRLSMNSKNSGGSGSIGSVAAFANVLASASSSSVNILGGTGALPSASVSKTSLSNRSNRSTRLFGSEDLQNLQQHLNEDDVPPVPDPVAEVQALLGQMGSSSRDVEEFERRPSSRSSLSQRQFSLDIPSKYATLPSSPSPTPSTASVAPLSFRRGKNRPSPLELSDTSSPAGSVINTPITVISPPSTKLEQVEKSPAEGLKSPMSPSDIAPPRVFSPPLTAKSGVGVGVGVATALRQKLESESPAGMNKSLDALVRSKDGAGKNIVVADDSQDDVTVIDPSKKAFDDSEIQSSNVLLDKVNNKVSQQEQRIQAFSMDPIPQVRLGKGIANIPVLSPSPMLAVSQNPFLPHPNAPKPNPATAGQRRSVLGLLSPDQLSPYVQQQESYPGPPPSHSPASDPNRLNGSRNLLATMRMALQNRFGPGGIMRPVTIFGRTLSDLSAADGPIGIMWSIEPFEPLPSPSPSPRPGNGPGNTMRTNSPIQSGDRGSPGLRVPVDNNGYGGSEAQKRGDAPPSSPAPSTSSTGNVLPRANFFPKVVTTRPRSRSFSGFSTSNAEITLPPARSPGPNPNGDTTGRSEAPARSMTIGSPVVEYSGTAGIERPLAPTPLKPGRSASPSPNPQVRSGHVPSPLSLSHNNTPAKSISPRYKAPPSPLSRPPISQQSLTQQGEQLKTSASFAVHQQQSQPQQFTGPQKHLGLRQVASSITLKSTPDSSRILSPPPVNQPLRRNSGPAEAISARPAANQNSSSRTQTSDRSPISSVPPMPTREASNLQSVSSSPGATGSQESSTTSSGDSRSAMVTSPPPVGGASFSSGSSIRRSTSLKSKVSLSILRGRHDSKVKESEEFATQSHLTETVQIKDTDFELVRPAVRRISADRRSEDTPGGINYLPPLLTDIYLESPVRASFGSPINARSQSLLSDSSTSPSRSTNAQEDQVSMEAHRARELRWMSAISSIPASQARKNKKIRKMLFEGVPSSVRYLVWEHLTDSKFREKPGVYTELGKRGRVNAFSEIERDVKNYFSEHQHLRESNGPLMSLLQSYLTMVPDIVYNASLVVLTGHLLLQSPEEVAFWTFTSMMDIYLRPYFSAKSVQLDVDAMLFSKAVEGYDAQIAKRLYVDLELPMADICKVWFSSLFAASLSPDYVNRIWDVFLYEGHPFLIRVGLSILSSCRRALLESKDGAQLLAILRRPPQSLLPPDPEALLVSALSFKLKDDDIRKQRTKLEAQMKRQTQTIPTRSISAHSHISLPRP